MIRLNIFLHIFTLEERVNFRQHQPLRFVRQLNLEVSNAVKKLNHGSRVVVVHVLEFYINQFVDVVVVASRAICTRPNDVDPL